MKLYFKLFITCWVLNIGVSQAQTWEVINSPPSTSFIINCHFLTEDLGWILYSDSLFKTTNGGETWVNQSIPPGPSGTSRILNSVHFINENVGIISIGYYGVPGEVSSTLWTTNGGDTWEYKDMGDSSDTGNFHYDAILVSPNIAYSIGQYENCKKTIDGGVTWTALDYNSANPVTYSASKLYALDQDNIWFVGIDQFSNPFTGAFAKENLNGWMVYDILDAPPLYDLVFKDINNGCIVGADGTIKYTNDAGNTWIDSMTPLIDEDINGISMSNADDTLWAISGDSFFGNGKIFKSTDDGVSWSINFEPGGNLRDVCFENLNGYGYVIADDNIVYKYTPDTGLNIEEVETKKTLSLYPNPANTSFTIELNNIDVSSYDVIIFNNLGQKIQQKLELNGASTVINSANMPNGIYYINVIVDNAIVATQKLVIN